MTLVLLILVTAWTATTLLMVALCRLAKRGDEALPPAPAPRAPLRPRVRGERPRPGRVGAPSPRSIRR